MFIRLLIFIGIFSVLAPHAWAAPDRVPARLFMQGREAEGVDITLAQFNDRRIRVFDQQTAYRNDQKACVRFELPAELPWADTPLRLELEAYNDDRTYMRAIWFEVDGIGGYLDVQRVDEGQHRGSGTIAPRERKRWNLLLDNLPLSLEGKTTTIVDLDVVLRQPGPHTICAWISTYAKYGPESWITLDVVGSPAPGSSDRQAGTRPAPAATDGKQPRSRRTAADPCSRWTWQLKDHGLQVALKQRPDSAALYDQPVCSVLEVSSTRGGRPETLLHSYDLNANEPRMPGYLLNYKFANYFPRSGLVVLQRARALRLYDVTTHTLSQPVGPRECIGVDAQSSNSKRLEALEDGQYLYGVAVNCHPFLLSTKRPGHTYKYLETIGTYALFADQAGRIQAAEPQTKRLYKFAARAGRDARFSLTYFLNDRGMAAYRQKNYMQAAKWFNRAAAVTPADYLYPHTNLAGSMALAGLTREALEQLQRACALDRSFTRPRMLRDSDFDSLRNYKQFREILNGVCAED